MTKLLASTALVAMLAVPALAQTTNGSATTPPAAATTGDAASTTTAATTTGDMGFGYMMMDGDMSSDVFIGKRLYVSETDVDPNAAMNDVDEGWDDIGEISDLIISGDGQVKAVIVDIGGFLGMGEKSVAVAMDQLRVIPDGDSAGDYFVVFTADRGALESAPEFAWPDAPAN
ncbi:PRC-barrel domain-containing protein [Frigidibacter sp. MR17.14]|uniref:PRC-barrel domain-containing protein n=1 Tax=Frigidibacter sp. MR17.14 TaxID=3126509 RepID=UPI003012C02E